MVLRFPFFATLLVLLALVGRARAQEPEQAPEPEPAAVDDLTVAAEAQALFRRGLELGEEDRWAEALELFRRSRALVARPSTVFNIGFALFRLGRFVQAIASFDEYLALTETETSDLRVEAARRRGEAIASLSALTLELTPETARLLVDGEASDAEGSPRTIALDPGRHVLFATADGYREGQLEISVLAAEHASRQLVLAPLVDAVGDEPPVTHDASLIEDPVFWVVTGVLVVGAAVAIGVGATLATNGPAQYGGSTGVVLLAL